MDYDYYDCDGDREILSNTDVDEAVADFLDRNEPKLWPDAVEVYGWSRMKYEFDADRILERALEDADEEHGNPDESTEPTPAMIAAARAFCEAMDREYTVWACERDSAPVATVMIADWVRKERPDWIETDAEIRAVILALERARDEAIRELDTPPPGGAK